MDVEEKLNLITRNTVEVVTVDELKKKLEEGKQLKGYLGFEPSGPVHIGWLIWANKVIDLINAGINMRILIATWHAWINDKLGGDLEKIKLAGEYALDVLDAYGMERSKIIPIDAEDLVKDKDYWALVLKIAKSASLARMKRALTIMGRKEEEAELDVSKLIYPSMQVADIFYMDLDIALGGTDQRKAHMLARDVADKLGKKKVIAIHTPLLVSLLGPQRMTIPQSKDVEIDDIQADIKMSKSKPESAIFVHDSESEVEKKIMSAYCPRSVVENNPILQISKYLLFPKSGKLKVERDIKYGGDIEFNSYKELERVYSSGSLHPLDLKKAVAKKLNELLTPIRKRLEEKPELEKLVKELEKNVTR